MKKNISVLFIGTGRAARGLSSAFSAAGVKVLGLVSRRRRAVRGFRVYSARDVAKIVKRADIVVLAVPDGAIAKTSEGLARRCRDVTGKVFVHLSGARESGDLFALRDKGAHTAALHPFYSFASYSAFSDQRSACSGRREAGRFDSCLTPRASCLALRQIPFSVEGPPEAVAVVQRLLGPYGVRAAIIGPRDKTLYHAAAVFSSNFTVGLQTAAQAMLKEAGVGDVDARLMVSALLTSTALNVVARGPTDALTGPVVRRDLGTIGMHLSELARRAPHLVSAYATMTLVLARGQGPKKLGKQFVGGLHALIARYLGEGEGLHN
ncbi:MAG: DUF2520 domain-containing protein [Deltaproteobacteria bacterium]|nr:DUF2520 domain-containing protein [Deltaproteobacteria bacterium]